jgi:hypothetical protein
MSERQEPIAEERVRELLLRPELREGVARDFALVHVYAFKDECRRILLRQRTEGRTLVLGGDEPERVKEMTVARIAEARRTLHGKLL